MNGKGETPDIGMTACFLKVYKLMPICLVRTTFVEKIKSINSPNAEKHSRKLYFGKALTRLHINMTFHHHRHSQKNVAHTCKFVRNIMCNRHFKN